MPYAAISASRLPVLSLKLVKMNPDSVAIRKAIPLILNLLPDQPLFGCLPVVKDTELIPAVRFQYHLPETTLIYQFRGEDCRNPDPVVAELEQNFPGYACAQLVKILCKVFGV
jgi:hypothetical protein